MQHRCVDFGMADKKIPGYAHTYMGSEAIATGVMEALNPDDWIASTYRCHGHAIAKGVDLTAMAAELYGRATGVAKDASSTNASTTSR